MSSEAQADGNGDVRRQHEGVAGSSKPLYNMSLLYATSSCPRGCCSGDLFATGTYVHASTLWVQSVVEELRSSAAIAADAAAFDQAWLLGSDDSSTGGAATSSPTSCQTPTEEAAYLRKRKSWQHRVSQTLLRRLTHPVDVCRHAQHWLLLHQDTTQSLSSYMGWGRATVAKVPHETASTVAAKILARRVLCIRALVDQLIDLVFAWASGWHHWCPSLCSDRHRRLTADGAAFPDVTVSEVLEEHNLDEHNYEHKTVCQYPSLCLWKHGQDAVGVQSCDDPYPALQLSPSTDVDDDLGCVVRLRHIGGVVCEHLRYYVNEAGTPTAPASEFGVLATDDSCNMAAFARTLGDAVLLSPHLFGACVWNSSPASSRPSFFECTAKSFPCDDLWSVGAMTIVTMLRTLWCDPTSCSVTYGANRSQPTLQIDLSTLSPLSGAPCDAAAALHIPLSSSASLQGGVAATNLAAFVAIASAAAPLHVESDTIASLWTAADSNIVTSTPVVDGCSLSGLRKWRIGYRFLEELRVALVAGGARARSDENDAGCPTTAATLLATGDASPMDPRRPPCQLVASLAALIVSRFGSAAAVRVVGLLHPDAEVRWSRTAPSQLDCHGDVKEWMCPPYPQKDTAGAQTPPHMNRARAVLRSQRLPPTYVSCAHGLSVDESLETVMRWKLVTERHGLLQHGSLHAVMVRSSAAFAGWVDVLWRLVVATHWTESPKQHADAVPGGALDAASWWELETMAELLIPAAAETPDDDSACAIPLERTKRIGQRRLKLVAGGAWTLLQRILRGHQLDVVSQRARRASLCAASFPAIFLQALAAHDVAFAAKCAQFSTSGATSMVGTSRHLPQALSLRECAPADAHAESFTQRVRSGNVGSAVFLGSGQGVFSYSPLAGGSLLDSFVGGHNKRSQQAVQDNSTPGKHQRRHAARGAATQPPPEVDDVRGLLFGQSSTAGDARAEELSRLYCEHLEHMEHAIVASSAHYTAKAIDNVKTTSSWLLHASRVQRLTWSVAVHRQWRRGVEVCPASVPAHMRGLVWRALLLLWDERTHRYYAARSGERTAGSAVVGGRSLLDRTSLESPHKPLAAHDPLCGSLADVTKIYNYLDVDKPNCNDRQVAVDIPRCHQYDAYLASSLGHASMLRVVKAWLLQNPNMIYWQGIDSVCAVLLSSCHGDEAMTFALLSFMMRHWVPHFFVSARQGSMDQRLLQLSLLLRFYDPLLALHLEGIECKPELYAISWFLTLFAHVLPMAKIKLLWDFLFASGMPEAVLCVACAVLMDHREALLAAHDFSSAVAYISTLWSHVDIRRAITDAEALLHSTPPSVLRPDFCGPLASLIRTSCCCLLDPNDLVALQDASLEGPSSEVDDGPRTMLGDDFCNRCNSSWGVEGGVVVFDIRTKREIESVEGPDGVLVDATRSSGVTAITGAVPLPFTARNGFGAEVNSSVMTLASDEAIGAGDDAVMRLLCCQHIMFVSAQQRRNATSTSTTTSLASSVTSAPTVVVVSDRYPEEGQAAAERLSALGVPKCCMVLGGLGAMREHTPQLLVHIPLSS